MTTEQKKSASLLVYPPSRFPARPPGEAAERWWVAKVKPRQEKQIAQDFFDSGIEYYLPLYIKNTPRPGSRSPRLFNVPLFPGYISFAQEKPHGVYSTGRLVSLIEIRNQRRFVNELNQIYHLLQGDAPLTPVSGPHLAAGTPVCITQGPFAGTKGIIHKTSSSVDIIVSVECLGNASLKINPSWVTEDISTVAE